MFQLHVQVLPIQNRNGSAGMAYAIDGNIWMHGSSFLYKTGPELPSKFLQPARISTAIRIPWSDGVLELGSCDNVCRHGVYKISGGNIIWMHVQIKFSRQSRVQGAIRVSATSQDLTRLPYSFPHPMELRLCA